MINSVALGQEKRLLNGFNECPNGDQKKMILDDDIEEMDVDIVSCSDRKANIRQDSGESHSKTVQALRKYLQRKLSSEDSSSERESPQEIIQDVPPRSFDTTTEPKSTLTFSIVQPLGVKPPFPFLKQRSLDDYSLNPLTLAGLSSVRTITTGNGVQIPDYRYLRTDLCVPILLSRCTFCDQSFEHDDELRAHMRDRHWSYFFDKSHISSTQLEHSSSVPVSEVLDLSMRKSSDETGSLPNLSLKSCGMDQGFKQGQFSTKKQVRCMTCHKVFSTKWNWKQHQKIHLRENLQCPQ